MSKLKISLVISALLISSISIAQDNGLSFDGVNDYVSFASAPSLSGGSTLTFEAWIYPTSVTGFRTIASWTDGGSNLIRFSIANGLLELYQDDGIQTGGVTGSVAINPNEWTHIAFVMTAGSIDFYVNGNQEPEGFGVASAGLSNIFQLGVYLDSFNPFEGIMDEVRIWDEALDQVTIDARRNTTLTGAEANLLAYYQFNESSGTVLPDLTTNAFDGVLLNGLTNTPPADGITNGPLWVASTALPDPFIVTNTNNSGVGSLRWCITNANATAGANTITFDFVAVPPGSQINIDSELTLTDNQTTIDADAGGDGIPDITIDAGSVNMNGFYVTGSNNLIQGFNFIDFRGPGTNAPILIDGAFSGGNGNTIVSNYIGTNLAGNAVSPAPNFRSLRIVNGASGNLIGNGTNIGRNIISGNTFGIEINASDNNTVAGNIIGLDATGSLDIGNGDRGIEVLNSNGTTIGAANEGINFISNNLAGAILLDNSTTSTIINNYIGTDITGNIGLGNNDEGIRIQNGSNNNSVGDGTIAGRNVISGNFGHGIIFSDITTNNNFVLGNYIGLGADGITALGNSAYGISIGIGSTGNTIGNGTADGGNTISGNGSHGILVADGPNTIQGNYIGLRANGNQIEANNGIGIFISGGSGSLIGGTSAGEGNVIAGNTAGISLSSGPNDVYGNIVGLDATASFARPNTGEGVRITANGTANNIGNGTAAGANIIAGNTDNGVSISGASANGNAINFNYIGTNSVGASLGNGLAGVRLESGATGNSLPENVIAYNQTGILANGITTQLNIWTQNSIYSNTTGISIVPASAQGGILPPTITSAPPDGMITGTSAPNASIDIFADASDQGEYLFGVAVADASGNWTCTCLGPLSSLPVGLNNITAVQNDGTNSSAFSAPFALPAPVPFITTWSTTDTEITIPTTGVGYNYNVVWTNLTNFGIGDGSTSGETGDFTITGLTNGHTYQVEITGVFPRIYFNSNGDASKILTIEQWGPNSWTSMASAFSGCTNLTITALDAPNLSSVLDMSFMFDGASSLNQNLSSWDVSNVTIMSHMFSNATTFNQDIDGWDVSNVLDMQWMFQNASSFNNSLASWVVSSVTNMEAMFSLAISFNQPISNWDVSAVASMKEMFAATPFNQDISTWNVGEVTDMSTMFFSAANFDQNIGAWNVSKVLTMREMFLDNGSFNQDLSTWDVSSVTDMRNMFEFASSFDQSLGTWDIRNVAQMNGMLNNTGLSIANYDATLIGWGALPLVQSSVTLGASGLNYCTGQTARNDLTTFEDWTFIDAGLLCPDINGVAPGDYNALVALYNATDGPNWTNNNNWLTATPVSNWFGVVTSGNRVQQVNLNDNNLVGTLPPEIGNLDNAIYFRVRGNTISGTIPVEVGNMATMSQLWLYDNQLSGTIPVELANILSLRELRLDQNQLTGTIPTQLGDLPNLWLLFLYQNQLTGTIPVTSINFPALTSLDLNNNQISGTIPTALGDHPNIDYLLLGDNQLTGTIPTELGNLVNLNYLQLHQNQLSGPIPSSLGATDLIQLYLYDNQLTGTIPVELGNLSTLEQLLLNQNLLTGTIPVELGTLSNLWRLRLHTNQLSGSIPSELGNLNSLLELELYNNQLSGNIPSALGSLSSLTILRLFTNQLTGSIPSELGNLLNLQNFRLEDNLLSGTIPTSLGNLTQVSDLRLAINQLTGPIPIEFGNLTNLQYLGLYQNQLTGSIPAELGNLTNLLSLNCFSNQLDGTVPIELTNLTQLTQLRLNDNLLSDLPDLSSLTNLTQFTIDNNYFEFDDIEPNVSLSGIVYAPQNPLPGPGDQTFSETQTIDLTINVGGSQNSYIWWRDDVVLNSQTTDNLFISGLTVNDGGVYRLFVTSTLAPLLTLNSEPFVLTVNPDTGNNINIFEGEDISGIPINVGQTDIDVGSTVIGTDIDKSFVIENSESVTLTITELSVDNPVFEVINAPGSVLPGNAEQFTIRLHADAEGRFTTNVTILSNFNAFNFSIIGEVLTGEALSVIVYNAVSPNSDGRHDFLEIEYINNYPNNYVKLMNRWGDIVYEAHGYDNSAIRFDGTANKNGNGELPSGTYYYQIDLGNGSPIIDGFFSLRR